LGGRIGRRLLKLSALIFSYVPTLASAAAVTGEVYDLRTGAVVAGAEVTLAGETATADHDGFFKLIAAPRGPGRMVAKAPGYAVTVIPYLPVVPTPAEIWRNVPLMPLSTAGPYRGDFVGLFFENAPLEELYGGYVLARRFEDLPLRVNVAGAGGPELELVAREVEALNERWGTSILETTAEDGGEIHVEFYAAAASFLLKGPAGAEASLPGGVTEENLALAAAFLRRVVLAGGYGTGVLTAEALRADEAVAEDLDAVVEIIYREDADFNYAIFKRRAPSRFSILTDLYLGIGGYERHGVTDGSGEPVNFPVEYQLGQITLAGGVGYLNLWAEVGFWFAGIWDAKAEEAYVYEGVEVEKVLRRNFSSYYRAGYWLTPAVGLRAGPFAGYRKFSVRGKFKEALSPQGPTAPLDVDYTSHYDGFEAGIGGDVAFGWYNLGLFGEYARVFAGQPYNLAEIGLGAVNRVGVGTYAFGRFYWGRPLDYTFGGLAMRLDIPL
jgi:hypothetical protein